MGHEGAERPSVDQYFMDMTHLVKARGTCPRRRVGAVIVKDKRVLTTGYNGAPRNFPHPTDVGCLRDELQVPRGTVADICPCLHAEQNAIIQAATTGVSIEGSDLYCTTQPCTQCSRMVANCGIRRVVFEEEYPDPLAIGILTTSKVELWKWDPAARKAHPLVRPNTFEQAQDEIRRRWKAGGFPVSPQAGGPLPIAGQPPPLPKPPAAQRDAPAGTESSGPAPPPAGGSGAGIRDLATDPNRRALLQALAKEKAERRKKARQEEDQDGRRPADRLPGP